MTYARKVDANQNAIVEELRARGLDVDIVHRLPGLYDLVVCGRRVGLDRRPCCVRVEVKQPGEKLTPAEERLHASARYPDALIIAYNTQDILDWFGIRESYT